MDKKTGSRKIDCLSARKRYFLLDMGYNPFNQLVRFHGTVRQIQSDADQLFVGAADIDPIQFQEG
jgi:hypothetical protein